MDTYRLRLDTMQQRMKERGLKATLLFPSSNLFYATGFHTFPEGRLLLAVVPQEGEGFFVAPKLYESQIKREAYIKDMVLWTDEEDPYALLKETMKKRGLEKGQMAVDDTMWAEQLIGIMNNLPEISFTAMGDMLNSLRLLKSSQEIEKIRKASKIVDDVLEVVKDTMKAGMTEIEVAALMEYEMRKKGSEGPSFETIVGSGPNGALPHYNAGQRRIGNGEFVVLDFGGTYQGYCSDTTRTLCVGEPTKKMETVYNIVREAQEIGVQTVRPGIKAKEVDEAVRKYIKDKGYGAYFTHRTGHGLGLQVHEEPYISAIGETVLEPGMVFSIEPGIYLEEDFGVRIEDIVVVTKEGCERLNNFPRELTKL